MQNPYLLPDDINFKVTVHHKVLSGKEDMKNYVQILL